MKNKIIIPQIEINSSVDLSRLEKPYSFVPTNGEYCIAKVTNNDKVWYMLVTSSGRKDKENNVRIVTTRDIVDAKDIKEETLYELIASNDIYKDIYELLGSGNLVSHIKPYVTIGFTAPSDFSTYTDCKIEVKQIKILNNNFGLGDNRLLYYLTLY